MLAQIYYEYICSLLIYLLFKIELIEEKNFTFLLLKITIGVFNANLIRFLF